MQPTDNISHYFPDISNMPDFVPPKLPVSANNYNALPETNSKNASISSQSTNYNQLPTNNNFSSSQLGSNYFNQNPGYPMSSLQDSSQSSQHYLSQNTDLPSRDALPGIFFLNIF